MAEVLGEARDTLPLKEQDFHRENQAIFKDYEKLEYKQATETYEKSFCLAYYHHCFCKVQDAMEAETESTLDAPSGISFKKFSPAELLVVNIRHIQHHAAQLGLRV